MAWLKYPKYKPVTLSHRQKEVLVAFLVSEKIKDTAVRLGIAEVTVRKYRETARLKLGAPTILAATQSAIRRRLLVGVARAPYRPKPRTI